MLSPTNIKIAIASGKGGTGKTLISTNIFDSLRRNGFKTTLVDCDAEEPNDTLFIKGNLTKTIDVMNMIPEIKLDKCTFCGKCVDYCNYNAIFMLPLGRVIKVMDDLCHGCAACIVGCNHDAIEEKKVSLGKISLYSIDDNADLVEARMNVGALSPVSLIKAAIKEASGNGILLLDAPPGTACPFIQTVATADYVILVAEPTPFGLSDLQHSVETLQKMNLKFGVIMNRIGYGDNAIYDYIYNENIELLMEIPFKREYATCYAKGEMVVKYDKGLEKQFISIIKYIAHKYGNCNY
jgi:MinD superfamily P-loop ATPase